MLRSHPVSRLTFGALSLQMAVVVGVSAFPAVISARAGADVAVTPDMAAVAQALSIYRDTSGAKDVRTLSPRREANGWPPQDPPDCNHNGVRDDGEMGIPFPGSALYFHGIELEDAVDAGNAAALNLTSSLTLEAWVFLESFEGNRKRIVSKGNPAISGYGFGNVFGTGALRFTTFGSIDYDTVGEYLVEAEWAHVAVVFDDGGDAHFYVGGKFVETVEGFGEAQPNVEHFHIGRNPDGSEPWLGLIDEVRVWSVERTSRQILDNYDRLVVGDEPGLVSCWRFDEGLGTTVADLANGHDGMLMFDAMWVDHGVDADDNGILDTCTNWCGHFSACADADEDGVRDDPCLSWRCAWFDQCISTDIVFGDVGGEFGSCQPDGVADGNDRYHVLNCFGDQGLEPGTDYSCEAAPPVAYHVDPGGAFGSCAPNGVCDGNDAFLVLAAFDGTTTCTCPLDGPRPLPPLPHDDTETTELSLVVTRRVYPAGEDIEVDVVLESSLEDLRGYQLHVDTAGGNSGTLELVDIHMPDHGVFDATWQAFNRVTRQMVAGADAPGGPVQPGTLATFIFRASNDAGGEFVIELLPFTDEAPDQRSFLFPGSSGGRIDIGLIAPVVVTIDPRRSIRDRR